MLYAVTVNWNLKQDTLECVESLRAAGLPPDRVVVVDNGSTDGSGAALRDRFGPTLRLVENRENLGFAAGSNLGIRAALEAGASWVLLVNNDTRVARTFLAEMEWGTRLNQAFAILAPLILFQSVPDRIWFLGDRLIPGTLATYSLHRGRKDRGQFPRFVPVDFVTGCGMLVRRDVFDRVGLFNPAFFMYGEDVDLSWRARLAGFRTAVVTSAKMWHKVSATANRDQPTRRYYRLRNQIRFYRRYAHGLQLPCMITFTALRTMLILLNDLIHGEVALVRPSLAAWWDGWADRTDSLEFKQSWNT